MITVSIITTVLNGAETIEECIKSVQGQTHPSVEHIVIDGGSTDGTQEILHRYRSSLAVCVSEADKGIYDGMNKGLRLATGDIVGILNSDDVYADDAVIAHVAQVMETQGVDSCYGDLVYVDADDLTRVRRYWRSGEFDLRRFYWGWMPPHPTFFVKRRLYEEYGAFSLSLGSAADYELMLRFLVRQRISAAYIPQVMVKMRTGGTSNVSLKARLKAHANDRKAWEVNGLEPYPLTLFLKPLRKVFQFLPYFQRLNMRYL